MNDEYYRIKNINELQQILKEIALNKALVNTKKIDKSVQLIFQKRLSTLYSFEEEFEYNQTLETQLQKIINTLKRILSNDVTTKRKFFQKNIEK